MELAEKYKNGVSVAKLTNNGVKEMGYAYLRVSTAELTKKLELKNFVKNVVL